MQQYTWFYTLENPLTDAQEQALRAEFDAFVNQWKSHGSPIHGKIDIRFKRFVIIQSDERDNRPSGCSIDSMRRSVTEILDKQKYQTLDSAYVSFRIGDEIRPVHFRDIPQLVSQSVLTPDTHVFDHSLGQSDDLSRWEVPLSATWLRRFLPKDKVG